MMGVIVGVGVGVSVARPHAPSKNAREKKSRRADQVCSDRCLSIRGRLYPWKDTLIITGVYTLFVQSGWAYLEETSWLARANSNGDGSADMSLRSRALSNPVIKAWAASCQVTIRPRQVSTVKARSSRRAAADWRSGFAVKYQHLNDSSQVAVQRK